MASASKTPNLNLPQWVGTEKPERTDFNAAFDAIDDHVAESASKHITESGSNANGNYIKFDDGTMICQLRTIIADKSISGAYAPNWFVGNHLWTFPHAFVGIPVASCGQFQIGSALSFGAASDTSTTQSMIRAFAPVSVPNGSAVIALTAIGRWK